MAFPKTKSMRIQSLLRKYSFADSAYEIFTCKHNYAREERRNEFSSIENSLKYGFSK